MLNWFRSGSHSKSDLKDFSFLSTDIHSHLLPGIDDGASTLEDSLKLLERLQSLGFKKAITTPHVMEDFYKNTPAIISGKLKEVQEAAKQAGLSIQVEAAAEYYMDGNFMSQLNAESLLTFGNKYVLFEISFVYPPVQLLEIVFQAQVKGYKLVLAHPERYPYWHHDFSMFEKLKETGVYFMVNTISFSGYYGKDCKVAAEKIAEKGWINFLASDTHAIKHTLALERSLQSSALSKISKAGTLLNPTV